MDFRLDAYFQGGVVGLKRRDAFVDGAVTATRPVYRNFSAGLGVWGGAQPGVYRIDAGPRVTMKVRENLRVHLDYRQRLAGNAEPGSGPTLTLAGISSLARPRWLPGALPARPEPDDSTFKSGSRQRGLRRARLFVGFSPMSVGAVSHAAESSTVPPRSRSPRRDSDHRASGGLMAHFARRSTRKMAG